jgi:hypothetical protein
MSSFKHRQRGILFYLFYNFESIQIESALLGALFSEKNMSVNAYTHTCANLRVRIIELSIKFDYTLNIEKGVDYCRFNLDQ